MALQAAAFSGGIESFNGISTLRALSDKKDTLNIIDHGWSEITLQRRGINANRISGEWARMRHYSRGDGRRRSVRTPRYLAEQEARYQSYLLAKTHNHLCVLLVRLREENKTWLECLDELRKGLVDAAE